MTVLAKFLEPITIADEPISNEFKAYKMDSSDENNDMRKSVGLGTCHCCDYFLPKDDFILLIEETRLTQKVNNIREKYHYLNEQDKNDAVNKGINNRMQLKAYGTMFILCRLAKKYSEVKKIIKNKKYKFFVVTGKIELGDEMIYFDSLRDSLNGTLKQVLGTTLLAEVKILSSDDFKRDILNSVSTP